MVNHVAYVTAAVVFNLFIFFCNATATAEIYSLSLHDALPISMLLPALAKAREAGRKTNCLSNLHQMGIGLLMRSEEHTSELQSRFDLVCRLLLEKKKH